MLLKINLDYLKTLTNSNGIMQHAKYNIPNFNEGYTTDDNARALILTVSLENNKPNKEIENLSIKYLSFLNYAFNENNRCFRNFMDYNGNWIDKESGKNGKGSEDSHARSLWALGFSCANSNYEGIREVSKELFEKALPATENFENPRPWAFSLIGINKYTNRFPDSDALKIGKELSNRLVKLYKENNSKKWKWFEPQLTYSNAKLPHSLIISGKKFNEPELIEIGLDSLEWLDKIQTDEKKGHFVPIGNNGWYKKNGKRARYDQQPIEAQEMISACIEAYDYTNENVWKNRTLKAFNWFTGKNDLGFQIYNPLTGNCSDGLCEKAVNKNQGAESTLAALISLSELNNKNGI